MLLPGVTRRCCWTRLLASLHNIPIVPLPPKCPELNPQENVRQYMRDN